jgi:hypothetical protein
MRILASLCGFHQPHALAFVAGGEELHSRFDKRCMNGVERAHARVNLAGLAVAAVAAPVQSAIVAPAPPAPIVQSVSAAPAPSFISEIAELKPKFAGLSQSADATLLRCDEIEQQFLGVTAIVQSYADRKRQSPYASPVDLNSDAVTEAMDQEAVEEGRVMSFQSIFDTKLAPTYNAMQRLQTDCAGYAGDTLSSAGKTCAEFNAFATPFQAQGQKLHQCAPHLVGLHNDQRSQQEALISSAEGCAAE